MGMTIRPCRSMFSKVAYSIKSSFLLQKEQPLKTALSNVLLRNVKIWFLRIVLGYMVLRLAVVPVFVGSASAYRL